MRKKEGIGFTLVKDGTGAKSEDVWREGQEGVRKEGGGEEVNRSSARETDFLKKPLPTTQRASCWRRHVVIHQDVNGTAICGDSEGRVPA